MNNKFKIIVLVYNSPWIIKCLNIIRCQSYNNFKCVVIDDASTDDTFKLAKAEVNSDPRFILVRNGKNMKAIHNFVVGAKMICDDDEDIIVSIDGDDWLFSFSVFSYLNEIYQDPNVWLTYGSYKTVSDDKKGCNRQIYKIEDVRNSKVNFSHLKTFKYHLWKHLKDEDLRREDGKYIQRAWDSPIMRPLIEMCGLKRIAYINKILYVYNNENPISEWKVDEKEQLEENDYVCSKERYNSL